MFITIDEFYDINFYNECKEALKNNNIEFREFIRTISPYEFVLEVDKPPTFINYTVLNKSQERYLVNIIKPLRPNDEYIYERRDSYTNKKAIKHYAVNDALQSCEKSGECVIFTANKDEALAISKDFPRKIWFMGRYFNRKYKIFISDNILINNMLRPDQILISDKRFKNITDIEVELNYNTFKIQDRLLKLSETPYVYKGRFYPINSTRPEISDKYVLS
jgi:hypothetical protein